MIPKKKSPTQDDADPTPDVALKPDDLLETEGAAPEAVAEEEDPLAALKAEADRNLDGWQRTLAEFQNYKRRVTREQSELRAKVVLETLAELLPILDDFERALASLPADLQGNSWVNGVALIEAKFKRLLDDYDITAIDPVGEEFNPNLHQAVGTGESAEYDSGQVIETLQKGYTCGDTLLRPALVYVAS